MKTEQVVPMNTKKNLILLSNPPKLDSCVFHAYIIIFGVICVWIKKVLFVLSNVKHELVAHVSSCPSICDEAKGQGVFLVCSHPVNFCTESFYLIILNANCKGEMLFFFFSQLD